MLLFYFPRLHIHIHAPSSNESENINNFRVRENNTKEALFLIVSINFIVSGPKAQRAEWKSYCVIYGGDS